MEASLESGLLGDFPRSVEVIRVTWLVMWGWGRASDMLRDALPRATIPVIGRASLSYLYW